MTTARIDHRPQRAANIVQAGDIRPTGTGAFRVRDIAGSGTWHTVTATTCTCMDFRRTGLQCKHQLALCEFQKPKGAVGPTCPTCGSPTIATQYYVAGCYRYFADCLQNPEHQAVKLS